MRNINKNTFVVVLLIVMTLVSLSLFFLYMHEKNADVIKFEREVFDLNTGKTVKLKSGGVLLKLSLGDASETYLFTLYENGFFRAEKGTSDNDLLKEPYFERGWYDYECHEVTYLMQKVDEIRKLADKIYNSKPKNDLSDVCDYDTFRLKYKNMVVQINSSQRMTEDMLELKERIIELSPIEVAFGGA